MTIIDRIRLIILPDKRKWSKKGPIYNARIDPENFNFIRSMIDHGFFEGDLTNSVPQITGITSKACDLYNATYSEGVRIRLSNRISGSTSVDDIHRIASELHLLYGDRRVKQDKWSR